MKLQDLILREHALSERETALAKESQVVQAQKEALQAEVHAVTLGRSEIDKLRKVCLMMPLLLCVCIVSLLPPPAVY